MTDQELRISVAEACGLEVITPKDSQRWSVFPKGAVIFWPENPDEGRLMLSGDNMRTDSWDPLHDLKLAYECSEKVWNSTGWVFAVYCHYEGMYSGYSASVSHNFNGEKFDTAARAICHAIHKWRTGEAS